MKSEVGDRYAARIENHQLRRAAVAVFASGQDDIVQQRAQSFVRVEARDPFIGLLVAARGANVEKNDAAAALRRGDGLLERHPLCVRTRRCRARDEQRDCRQTTHFPDSAVHDGGERSA